MNCTHFQRECMATCQFKTKLGIWLVLKETST